MARVLLALIAALLLVMPGCGGGDSKPGKSTVTSAEKVGGCESVSAPGPKADGSQKPATKPLAANKTYSVTFTTSCGDFTVKIDQKTSPRTAASFVSLVRKGFFDDTVFHRIVPGFVIQGGDPTGTGSGGPGYSTRDVPPANTKYTRGSVAMAKTAAEASGTAGSQFYVVTGADIGLPPQYAVLGKVTAGLKTTGRISAQGDPQSGGEGIPLHPVVIEKATVSER
jgi:cyclophilin family peptidyl-prolyl cis-trans isomerase